MSKTRSIIFFTKYTDGAPVSRYRSYAINSFLTENGFVCRYHSLYSSRSSSKWYGTGKEVSTPTLFFAVLKRLLRLLFVKEHDVAIVEYPFLPGTSYRLQKWLLRKQKSVVTDLLYTTPELINGENDWKLFVSSSRVVITPGSILTKRALAIADNVTQIPPGVQVKEYASLMPANITTEEKNQFRIGWIGTQATSLHLLMIKDCLFQLHDLYHIHLVMIGFDKKSEKEWQGLPYTIHTRNTSTEISLLKTCDAGILPLSGTSSVESVSFPMIQYAACGLPFVASSNELTIAINHGNDNLFARTPFEWYSCLAAMIQNKEYYKEIGERNIRIADEFYSVENTGQNYLSLLQSIRDNRL